MTQMLTDVSQPSIQLGPFRLYSCGILLTLGVIIGAMLFRVRSRANGLSRRRAWLLTLICIPAGFLGAHLMYCALDEPSAIFSFGGVSSLGGALAALCGFAFYAWISGWSRGEFWQWLDVGAYSSVFGSLIARTGCALAHDHLGIVASSRLSVDSPIGPRLDLGFLEVIFLGVASIAVLFLDHRGSFSRAGRLASRLALAYGAFRFILSYLRLGRLTGFSIEQCAALVFISISILRYFQGRAERMNSADLRPRAKPVSREDMSRVLSATVH